MNTKQKYIPLFNSDGNLIDTSKKISMNGGIIQPSFYRVKNKDDTIVPFDTLNLLRIYIIEKSNEVKDVFFPTANNDDIEAKATIDTLTLSGTVGGAIGEKIKRKFIRSYTITLEGIPVVENNDIATAVKDYELVQNILLGKLYHNISRQIETGETVRIIH